MRNFSLFKPFIDEIGVMYRVNMLFMTCVSVLDTADYTNNILK